MHRNNISYYGSIFALNERRTVMKTFIAMASGAIIFISGMLLGAYVESDEIRQKTKRAFRETKENQTEDHTSSVLHDCQVKGFCSDYAE